ncbi:MAG: MerR family transcriptional regulator [Candidatus Eremiobacteraeota bacterium]|nr:MerR family transcriptional regulator [Candidatus Eremiobacteraeota bacterium]
MLRRLPQKRQLDLFEGAVLYVTQADAARLFGITTRMIQYWEQQGLLNPELPVEGRSRKYTNFDLVEMRFIKTLVVDQGYTVPALKEKLAILQSPYYYDPEDAFWDLRDNQWKSRSTFAVEKLAEVREELEGNAARALETLLPSEPENVAKAVLNLVREYLEGKAGKKKR